jgi:hypothetical protein
MVCLRDDVQIGASTFSTNVGAPMFLGMAGSAAASGVAITMFEWHVRKLLWRSELIIKNNLCHQDLIITLPCCTS